MQAGILSYPHWQVALAILLGTVLLKGSLSFTEALAKNNRSNGNGKNTLPKGLEQFSRDSPALDALRIGESCCGVVVSVIIFLFFWDLAALIGFFPTMFSKIMLAIGLAGLTTLLMHASTISFPKLLALKTSPHAWRKVFWIPVGLSWVTWPVRFLVKVKDREMRRFMRVPQSASKEVGLRAEIEALDDETNDLMSSGIRQIVGNTLQLRNLDAQDILMPRNQIQVLELNDSIEKNLALAKSSGHTRFPLCDGDLDHCVGIVHVKDVFRQMAEGKEVKLDEIKRDFATFSPEIPLIEVLQKMLQGRLHMALVRDEFGGAIGVVTLEDALEEVVGEIKDEFDTGEEDPVRKREDGSFSIAGLAQTHDVEEILGTQCGNDEVSTFGGWITMALGRIPQQGESFLLGDLEVTVEKAEGGRVIETTVTPLSLESDKDTEIV